MVERAQTCFAFRFEQFLRNQSEVLQFVRRQVTTADAQVGGQIPKNVYELEPLAKADGIDEQRSIVKGGAGEEVRAADFSPELADTAGYSVGVIVEFFTRT